MKASGEYMSADMKVAEEFLKSLDKLIMDKNYPPEQIFNMDESSLFWKWIPEETFIHKEGRSVPGFKAFEDRVTVLLRGNVSGYKLKPFVVWHSFKQFYYYASCRLYFFCLEFTECHWPSYKNIAFIKFGKTLGMFSNIVFCFLPPLVILIVHKVVLQITVALSFFLGLFSLVSFWLISIAIFFCSLIFSSEINNL